MFDILTEPSWVVHILLEQFCKYGRFLFVKRLFDYFGGTLLFIYLFSKPFPTEVKEETLLPVMEAVLDVGYIV